MKKQKKEVKVANFTLIELLVVIAIIAILASMLLPALNKARDKAKTIQCMGNMKQMAQAALIFANDNQGHLPSSGMADSNGFIYDQDSPSSDANYKRACWQTYLNKTVFKHPTITLWGMKYETTHNIKPKMYCPKKLENPAGGDYDYAMNEIAGGSNGWYVDPNGMGVELYKINNPLDASKPFYAGAMTSYFRNASNVYLFMESAQRSFIQKGVGTAITAVDGAGKIVAPTWYATKYVFRHGGAGTFSFVDGHATILRYNQNIDAKDAFDNQP